MKKMRKLCSGILALLAALAICALAGCAAEKPPEPAPEQPAEQPAAPASPQTPAPAPAAKPDETINTVPPAPADDALHVGSAEELLEAIAPDTKIVLEAGKYNLTDFLRNYPNVRDCDAWNEEHPYVKLGAVFDGVEVTICDVNGLSVRGGGDDPAETELVTEPRYAAVLNFENCSGIELSGLTMGHTEAGDCSGNVLDFAHCRDVELRDMDLYGCGVYGVCATDGSGDLTVSDSTIRDCAYGSLVIEEGMGDFTFADCVFSGSGSGGYYEPTKASRLNFINCSFDDGESTGWYFRNTAFFENCTWGDILSYPDRGETLEESYCFYPEQMEQIAFEDTLLGPSNWIGFITVDPQSGETEYLGLMGQDSAPSLIASFDLNTDGTGTFVLGSEKRDVRWEPINTNDICLESDEGNIYLSLYRMREPDGGRSVEWLLMQYDNDLIWLF